VQVVQVARAHRPPGWDARRADLRALTHAAEIEKMRQCTRRSTLLHSRERRQHRAARSGKASLALARPSALGCCPYETTRRCRRSRARGAGRPEPRPMLVPAIAEPGWLSGALPIGCIKHGLSCFRAARRPHLLRRTVPVSASGVALRRFRPRCWRAAGADVACTAISTRRRCRPPRQRPVCRPPTPPSTPPCAPCARTGGRQEASGGIGRGPASAWIGRTQPRGGAQPPAPAAWPGARGGPRLAFIVGCRDSIAAMIRRASRVRLAAPPPRQLTRCRLCRHCRPVREPGTLLLLLLQSHRHRRERKVPGRRLRRLWRGRRRSPSAWPARPQPCSRCRGGALAWRTSH
jgi:hypothetical protein